MTRSTDQGQRERHVADGRDRTVGIDLASQPQTTAVCVLAWPRRVADSGTRTPFAPSRGASGEVIVEALESGADDARLLELMLSPTAAVPTKVGIDAPFGWPTAFRDALASGAWPPWSDAARDRLVRRRTDHWVHRTTGKLPLSVSADRIAYPAMRLAALLGEHAARSGEPTDRSGVHGRLCEVYPDPAIILFGIAPADRRLSYKRGPGEQARAEIVRRLGQAAPWLAMSDHHRLACVASDDILDALVAALVARAASLGLTHQPDAADLPDARSEGWIHIPREHALGQLVGTPAAVDCPEAAGPGGGV